MNIETLIWIGGLLAIIGPALWWGYKKYQLLNADGKITLDEIIDVADEVKDKAEELSDAVKEHLEEKP